MHRTAPPKRNYPVQNTKHWGTATLIDSYWNLRTGSSHFAWCCVDWGLISVRSEETVLLWTRFSEHAEQRLPLFSCWVKLNNWQYNSKQEKEFLEIDFLSSLLFVRHVFKFLMPATDHFISFQSLTLAHSLLLLMELPLSFSSFSLSFYVQYMAKCCRFYSYSIYHIHFLLNILDATFLLCVFLLPFTDYNNSSLYWDSESLPYNPF